jgi:hypothetical protein
MVSEGLKIAALRTYGREGAYSDSSLPPLSSLSFPQGCTLKKRRATNAEREDNHDA